MATMHNIKPNLLAYVAGPYTHNKRSVEIKRFKQLTKVSSILLLHHGINNFSPITHSHTQAVTDKLPGTWAFWKQVDIEYVYRCDIIIVTKLPGWKESIGVTAEINLAKEIGRPVL